MHATLAEQVEVADLDGFTALMNAAGTARRAGAAKCVLYVFCLCISWHLLVPFDTQTWWYTPHSCKKYSFHWSL